MAPEPLEIFTIGHSTHSYENFISLLRKAEISAIADVRSSPSSRRFPQFNLDELRAELRSDGIAYVFLGKELGGRPSERRFYCEGVADYEKMATSDEFKEGLGRVIEGAKKYRIALMCSEHNPLDCHRCLLVGRALSNRGIKISHILANGSIAPQTKIEQDLLDAAGRSADDLLMTAPDRLAEAYRERARKVAYSDSSHEPKGSVAAE